MPKITSRFWKTVLAKKLISDFSRSEALTAEGRFSGGSERTLVPQAMEAVLIFSEGRCQTVASSAIFKI
jgi:hypothetical protein